MKIIGLVSVGLAAMLWAQAGHCEVLDDGKMAKVIAVADEGEVDAAKAVHSELQNSQVKQFAETMINEHKENKQKIKKVADDQKLSMANSQLATDIKKDGKKTVTDLKRQAKSDVDRAYIASQIRMHQTLLDKIDQEMLPKVQNENLKDFLTETRKDVQAHLDKAQELNKSL